MCLGNLTQPSAPRRQRGAALVELALVMVLMLLIAAATIEFGRAFWYADALTKAARDGARLMSTWPVASINSAGIDAVQTLVVNTANAANVEPVLTAAKVQVQCLNAAPAFTPVACVDGTAPANLQVSITGFNITIGAWFPFAGRNGLLNFGVIGMAPHTTMRYMN